MKLEIKDGMLIRTKGGNIYKILDEEAEIKFRMDLGIEHPFWHNGNFENEIIKASYNIIDLIEIDDIVQIKESIDNYSKSYFIGIDEMATLRTIKERIENNILILESILTHEQFANNCYKIGD